MTEIDKTAVIDPGAELGDGCLVGPYVVVGPEVKIGKNCRIGPHCVFHGKVTVGDENVFISQAAVGGPPQDISYQGEPTELVIGSGNTVREFVTLNRGTQKGGGVTRIGDGNLFMAYSHVAHDCQVSDGAIFANAATLAGHVEIGNRVTIGAFSAVHQFCRIGDYAFVGGFSVITKDAMPYIKVVGARGDAKIYGINSIGLERKGFSKEAITSLKKAYRLLFKSDKLINEALVELESSIGDKPEPEVRFLMDFIKKSERGIQR